MFVFVGLENVSSPGYGDESLKETVSFSFPKNIIVNDVSKDPYIAFATGNFFGLSHRQLASHDCTELLGALTCGDNVSIYHFYVPDGVRRAA
jgi:hypothetical protein